MCKDCSSFVNLFFLFSPHCIELIHNCNINYHLRIFNTIIDIDDNNTNILYSNCLLNDKINEKNSMIAIQLKFRIANIPFTIMMSPPFRLLLHMTTCNKYQALIEQSQLELHMNV